jgi:hypothetical protein
VRRERQESALAESGRVVAVSEPKGSITPVWVVIGAFAIGILTGAVGLFVAVLLSGS